MNKRAVTVVTALLLIVHSTTASAEQEGDTPKTRKGDDRVDDPADDGILTAEDPGNQVELKDTDQTPVDTTDDGKYQCQSIQHN